MGKKNEEKTKKNRRYKYYSNVLKGNGYFSLNEMKERRPVLYHNMVGKYRKKMKEGKDVDNSETKQQAGEANEDDELFEEGCKLSERLLRNLAGDDTEHINYSQIDNDPSLDDLDIINRDAEENYFETPRSPSQSAPSSSIYTGPVLCVDTPYSCLLYTS
eukprot:TRINITY_DN8891_c0_g1_i1.p1 TRINITY_DN8891_c0_g1~~TRINITY_DN8891_c0_g1_i1.p1  ORF type:complete len:160 (-),score=47.86 TRINITY_DN8891_c0_g1_i1:4-483(-)